MGEGIFKIIFDIYANQATIAQTYANLIEPKVRLIAGIGALVYIFGKLIIQIANNQEIDFFPFLRPFAILLLIPLSPQICSAIDSFGEEVRVVVHLWCYFYNFHFLIKNQQRGFIFVNPNSKTKKRCVIKQTVVLVA